MFDTTEFDRIIEMLENLDDEQLAAQLLQKFTTAQSKASKLLLNHDHSLDHHEWKAACDKANEELRAIVEQIEKVCI